MIAASGLQGRKGNSRVINRARAVAEAAVTILPGGEPGHAIGDRRFEAIAGVVTIIIQGEQGISGRLHHTGTRTGVPAPVSTLLGIQIGNCGIKCSRIGAAISCQCLQHQSRVNRVAAVTGRTSPTAVSILQVFNLGQAGARKAEEFTGQKIIVFRSDPVEPRLTGRHCGSTDRKRLEGNNGGGRVTLGGSGLVLPIADRILVSNQPIDALVYMWCNMGSGRKGEDSRVAVGLILFMDETCLH